MASREFFTEKFLAPLVECFGKTKFPSVRVQKIWEKIEHYPDYLIAQCADRIILNFDQFPGMSAILNTCGELGNEYMKSQADEIKKKINCSRCQSNGYIVVNNFAYQCDRCALGRMLYPAWPKYDGQVPFRESIERLEDGTIKYENAKIVAYTKRSDRINTEYRLIIKDHAITEKKKDAGFKKLSFQGI